MRVFDEALLAQTAESFSIDDSRMPLRLGSALRIPSYAWENWSITGDADLLHEASEWAYQDEWKGGSDRQIRYLAESAKMAGNPGNLGILREACAQAVKKAVKKSEGRVYLADIGAGLSTTVIYEALDKEDKERVYLYLLEPSQQRLEKTAEYFRNRGLEENKDFSLIADKDLNIQKYIQPESIHIITGVATVHHHHRPDFNNYYETLVPGGFIILADLHNHMFEHPNRIYNFLETLEWETKSSDLAAFAEKFPKAKEQAPPLAPPAQKADELIYANRRGWTKVRAEAVRRGEFDENDDLHLFEAHIPVEKYLEAIEKAGFSTKTGHLEGIIPSNPLQLIPDASLLMITAGRKLNL
ncbi:MAG: hypothetical protein LWY06_09330 [Firmicutes bacterium]|nr:hypothetical protein [Bacillota bacterium]